MRARRTTVGGLAIGGGAVLAIGCCAVAPLLVGVVGGVGIGAVFGGGVGLIAVLAILAALIAYRRRRPTRCSVDSAELRSAVADPSLGGASSRSDRADEPVTRSGSGDG